MLPKNPSHIPTPLSLVIVPSLFIRTSFLSSQPLPFNPNPSSMHPINISPLIPTPPPSASSYIHSSSIQAWVLPQPASTGSKFTFSTTWSSPSQQCFLRSSLASAYINDRLMQTLPSSLYTTPSLVLSLLILTSAASCIQKEDQALNLVGLQ